MTKQAFDINTFNVEEFDRILACGLSSGLGNRGKQVCIEAAICQVLGLEHGDDPGCVANSVRRFKIGLNDSTWSSPLARAEGLHDLGLAQLGSLGVVKDKDFVRLLGEKLIRRLIPTLFREVFHDKPDCLEAAKRCEDEGTLEAIRAARDVSRKYSYVYAGAFADAYADAYAAANVYAFADAYADAYAAAAAFANAYADAYAAANVYAFADAYADAYAAAFANAYADAYAAANVKPKPRDKYLNLTASLALETLRELNSPGIQLLKHPQTGLHPKRASASSKRDLT